MSSLTYDTGREELLRFVPSDTRRLLDIGCGVGRYGEALRRARPELEVWGVEPDAAHAAAAADRLDHLVHGHFPDVGSRLPASAFDVVTFNDVLEHVPDPRHLLDASRRHLVTGGSVIASIPNVRHLSVVWPLVRRGAWDYEEFGLLDRTHLRFFTRSSIVALFREAGWTVESISGVNPRWHWRLNEEGRRLRLVRSLARHRLDDFFFVQYVVIAKPPT